ncbi:MAG TPA: hypothetical protein PK431_01585 [Chitinophagales bacterium]|nr:hypothetical protein [Chitinophagales bacterium]
MIGKSYILTSTKFDGEIELVYDERDNISGFEIRTELSHQQLINFFGKFPITIPDIKYLKESAVITILEVPEDLSFDNFWKQWCGKQANKERASLLWQKMPKKNKTRCMWSLKAYKRYIDRNASWYNTMYPDSYLSPRNPAYLNDYNKM